MYLSFVQFRGQHETGVGFLISTCDVYLRLAKRQGVHLSIMLLIRAL